MLLPCTNCGHNLNIIKGAIVQCFACGTKNVHFDSYDLINAYLNEVLGYSKYTDEIKDQITEETLNYRINQINEYFTKYLEEINGLSEIVVSRVSGVSSKEKLQSIIKLGKNLGMLKILIDVYILPYVKGSIIENQYKEYSTYCEIYQYAILGYRFTLEAAEGFKAEEVTELYEKAAQNFEKSSELSLKYSLDEQYRFDFNNEKETFDIAAKFVGFLKAIIYKNPTYYSDDFELLMNRADQLNFALARSLKNEINKIYTMANEAPVILEEMRKIKPIMSISSTKEKILYHSEEIIEQVENAKIWLNDIEERYKTLQGDIVKLHVGQFITYITNYRKEFYNRYKAAVEKYNQVIGLVVQNTLLDYTIYTTDLLEEMENITIYYSLPANELIERVRLVKKDILDIDSELKEFLFAILEMGLTEDDVKSLKAQHSLSIISDISEKHSIFDKLIFKYIKKITDAFIDERDEKRYTIEEQRDMFNVKVRPIIDNLLELSFTLKEDQIPYPLFMEVIMLSTTLEVEKEYGVNFILENPSKIPMLNVDVTFFVPNSFKIKLREYHIGKLKPNKKINVETRIIPTKPGIYHFMTMAQYEYSKEQFWMPSLKFKLKVVEGGELSKKLDEDEVIDEIYKKYGKVVEEQGERGDKEKESGKNKDKSKAEEIGFVSTPTSSTKSASNRDSLLPDLPNNNEE
ncbi:MAG: hypothetical protein ACTSU2_00190 [Promethearchaeota archaeon]